jgi:hypothetical protein
LKNGTPGESGITLIRLFFVLGLSFSCKIARAFYFEDMHTMTVRHITSLSQVPQAPQATDDGSGRTLMKGRQTKATIVNAALGLASQIGLEGLSIGALAEVTGMSKSGVFAHFGSREELQISVIRECSAPPLKLIRVASTSVVPWSLMTGLALCGMHWRRRSTLGKTLCSARWHKPKTKNT